MTINLPLSLEEARILLESLGDVAIQMDDDGREGSFDASGLGAIETRLAKLLRDLESKP